MDNEKLRAEFEEWARSTFSWHTWEQVAPEEPKTISSWDGEKYGHRVVNGMWLAWQASRSALVVELPPSIDEDEDWPSDCWNNAVTHCARSLHAAGIKTTG
mgnify:CR=1 FL=1